MLKNWNAGVPEKSLSCIIISSGSNFLSPPLTFRQQGQSGTTALVTNYSGIAQRAMAQI
jgi:hypothetical protein